jgi:hypothetical protein
MRGGPNEPATGTSNYRRYISASLGAWVLTFFFVPMFAYPMGWKSHYSIEGTLLACIAGMLGTYGFLGSPRRPIMLKLGTAIVCVFSAIIGIFAVIQYIRFGRSS